VKRKFWIILIISVVCISVIYLQFKNTVNLSEKLPIEITENNILYGKIRAYHPDIFYLKYNLKFTTDNDIIKENTDYSNDSKIQNYFYYNKNSSKGTNVEKTILMNNSAQTYLKIVGQDKSHYIFTVSGDHAGSANYRDLTVKLYKFESGKYELVFDRKETYSTDPGIESNFFTERVKLLIYRKLNLDDRY